ncbi:hypothetical protein BV898_00720 [Hypsibius exemplaris]|uniref:Receptor ligand binding region domain-containing protein n=1 Tax=Hypsibius exemplaris TaxID=2072580 RepID=A0A1W0XEC4_HYPEX|nr:hypothetical protein BV898_00720 [Hypsibius exemplaris]
MDYFLSATLGLLRLYQWTTVYVVSDAAGTAFAASSAMNKAVLGAIQNAKGYDVSAKAIDPARVNFTALVAEIKTKARVVLMFGHALNLRRLMASEAGIKRYVHTILFRKYSSPFVREYSRSFVRSTPVLFVKDYSRPLC